MTMKYNNPIIPGFNPDPSCIQVDGVYYLVTSTFLFSPGLPIYASHDLVNWTQIANVVPAERSHLLVPRLAECGVRFPIGGGLWAPTLRYREGTWYITVTLAFPQTEYADPQRWENLLFKASAPSGPWSEPIVFNFPGYDTSLAWTDSGECYVQGAHYWRVRPEILQYRIDLDTGAILPSPGFDAPDQPAQSHKIWSGLGGKAPEAPHQYYRDGWWYLLIAEGGTESGHMSTIARSRCLTAPHDEWEPCPSNPLLTSYPSSSDSPDPLHFTTIGHADLFQAPSGEWFAVALATRDGRDGRASMGRETVLVPAQWREREWPTADKVEGRMELSLPAVTADDKPVEGLPLMREGETEDILALCSAYRQKDDAWPPHLLFLRVPELSRYGLVSSSKLVLHPSRSTLAKQDLTRSSGGTTTFIGRRQTDLEGSMTCALTISTSRTISAGLATFLDETHHVTIDVTATENGARVAMEGMASAVGTSAAELTTQAGAQVELRIDFTMEEFTFSYREEGGAWTELGRVDSKELSGGFTGMVLGLWANTSADDELTEDVLFSAWQYASVRKY